MQIKTLTPTTSAVPDFASAGVDIGDITNYSYQAVFTGSDVAGTFKLQVSNDGTSYVDLSGATASVTSSGDCILNITDSGYRYVRFDWNYSSGTGNITVTFCAKEALGRRAGAKSGR